MIKKISFIASVAALSMSCEQTPSNDSVKAIPVAFQTVTFGDNDPISLGGYGSSIAYSRVERMIYLLTDRGPNVDGVTPESKHFMMPLFTPSIARFELDNDTLRIVKKIELKDKDGTPLLGLPNREGDGVTGEVAYDLSGSILNSEKYKGVDSEGLAISPDRTFWVSDEYGPFIMQFDKEGTMMRELSPGVGMPEYYAKRRPNKGMEGLTFSDDGSKIFGLMQSPLYFPDNRTKNISRNCRILEINTRTKGTRDLIYRLESPRNILSDILYVNDSTLYVIERDEKFPNEEGAFKKIFAINIAAASDVSNIEMEMWNEAEFAENNITVPTKSLVVDILEKIPDYPHDKPEGIALIDDSILLLINDDDFGVTDDAAGCFKSKINAKGVVDQSILYMINL